MAARVRAARTAAEPGLGRARSAGPRRLPARVAGGAGRRVRAAGPRGVSRVLPFTLLPAVRLERRRVVLDPLPRWLDAPVIVNDDLPLSTVTVRGEDGSRGASARCCGTAVHSGPALVPVMPPMSSACAVSLTHGRRPRPPCGPADLWQRGCSPVRGPRRRSPTAAGGPAWGRCRYRPFDLLAASGAVALSGRVRLLASGDFAAPGETKEGAQASAADDGLVLVACWQSLCRYRCWPVSLSLAWSCLGSAKPSGARQQAADHVRLASR